MPLKIDLGRFATIGGFIAFVIAGAFVKGRPMLATAIGFGTFAFLWYVVRKQSELGGVTKAFLITIAASYPLVFYNNGGVAGYYHGGMVLASIGVALGFLKDRLWLWSAIALGLLTLYYVFYYFQLGGPEGIFIGSRNRVSTLFVALAVFIFVQRRHRFDILISLVVFAVCVSASGSSGIVSSGILFVAVLVRTASEWRGSSRVQRTFAAVLGITVTVAIGVYGPRYLGEEAQQKLRMERLTGSDVRYQIIETYAEEHLRGLDLFIGVPLGYSFVVSDVNDDLLSLNNLHNSYLDLHSKTGIFAVIVMAAILCRLAQLLRRSPFVAMLMAVILIRAFSDTVFILGGAYNFAFYVFLLPLKDLLEPHVSVNTEQTTGYRRLVRAPFSH